EIKCLKGYGTVKSLGTTAVVGLIVLGDETHQSCIVRKLHHVIGAVGWCAVVSQQGGEQGTEHTALWGPSAECDAARGVVACESAFSRWVRAGWRAERIASSVERLARYANS